MQIAFVSTPSAGSVVAVPAHEGALSGSAQAWDGRTGGALSRALAGVRYGASAGQTLSVFAPEGADASQVLLVGAGKAAGFDAAAAEATGAYAYGAVKTSGAATLALDLGGDAESAARAAFGARLASYRFDKYRTTEKPEKKPTVERVEVVTADTAAAEAAYAPLLALAEAVEFSRDLASEPANILYPAEFARRVQELTRLGLEVQVLGEAEMAELGMGALLGVGQGSVRESQLVAIRWNGAEDPNAAPVAFVGKGVCFDTGGISIKPAEGMEDMKWDMAGAGAVAGLMHALAGRKAKVNAVGVLGLVENMPDGNAQRPGDVVRSMSGQTIEVLNTDAEGRLVLADALWWTKETYKPVAMIDLATLTGAMLIALGLDYAGVFTNHDDLAEGLLAASAKEGEPLWRMPLPDAYDKHIDSPVADVKNLGNGRNGGSITAALFLRRFVGDTPWAHLDIAPVAWKKPSSVPTIPEGATGYGVRLLNRWVQDRFEG